MQELIINIYKDMKQKKTPKAKNFGSLAINLLSLGCYFGDKLGEQFVRRHCGQFALLA